MKKVLLLLLVVLSLLLFVACEEDAIENILPGKQDSEVAKDAAITAQEAEDIALTHAGFAREDVTRLHTEYDRDWADHYDVAFHKDGYEYEYEIDANTGEILNWEKEWAD